MLYPSLEQYNQAFQLHSRLLSDPELRAGSVLKTGLGLPLAISGGFALTYTISSGGKKYAVRCFHRKSNALVRRYEAISGKISSLNSPYFLDFQFQPHGIRVEGIYYPVVKMAWAGGETLGEFLEVNRKSSLCGSGIFFHFKYARWHSTAFHPYQEFCRHLFFSDGKDAFPEGFYCR